MIPARQGKKTLYNQNDQTADVLYKGGCRLIRLRLPGRRETGAAKKKETTKEERIKRKNESLTICRKSA